jgi:hypothetical protein
LKFLKGLFERLSRTSLQFTSPLGNGGRTRVLPQPVIGDERSLLGRRQFDELVIHLRPQHVQHLPGGMFFQFPQPRTSLIGRQAPMQFDDAEPQLGDLSQ